MVESRPGSAGLQALGVLLLGIRTPEKMLQRPSSLATMFKFNTWLCIDLKCFIRLHGTAHTKR